MSDEDDMMEYLNVKRQEAGSIILSTENCENFLMLSKNGDFYVKGNLVTTDLEIYEGFKAFLKAGGFL